MKTIRVKVKPGAPATSLSEGDDGVWRAAVREVPTDGRANAALVGLIAAHFGVTKRNVRIKSGAASRIKSVEIDD